MKSGLAECLRKKRRNARICPGGDWLTLLS